MTIHKFTNSTTGLTQREVGILTWLTGYGYDLTNNRVVSFKQVASGYVLAEAPAYKLSHRGSNIRVSAAEIAEIARKQNAATKKSQTIATTGTLWPQPKDVRKVTGNSFAAAVSAGVSTQQAKHIAAQFPVDPFAAYPAEVRNRTMTSYSLVYSALNNTVAVPAHVNTTIEAALKTIKNLHGVVVAPEDLRIFSFATEKVAKLTRKTTYTI